MEPLLGGAAPKDLDPLRFYVLGLFLCLTTLQCVLWFTFSSASTPGVAEYYGWSTRGKSFADARLDELLNYGAIGGVLALPFATRLLSEPGGLRLSLRVAAALELSCCVVRLLPSWLPLSDSLAWYLLSGAQLLNAFAGPLMMGSCSMCSATWFPPKHRATATAVAYCGGNCGAMLGFALGPLVIKNQAANVPRLLELELMLAAVLAFAAFAYLPVRSRCVVSAAVSVPESGIRCAACYCLVKPCVPVLRLTVPNCVRASTREWLRRLHATWSNRPLLVIALITGVEAGVSTAWSALIPQQVAPPRYSATTAATLGVLNSAGMLAGNCSSCCCSCSCCSY